MRRLTTTAVTAQPETTPRPVMHASALVSLWLLALIVLAAVGYLLQLPAERVVQLEVLCVAASSAVMLIAGPVKAILDFIEETWWPPVTEPTGPTTQLVPVNAHKPRVAVAGEDRPRIAPEDLADMIDQLDTRGHSVRAWRGQELASGHVIRSAEDESYRAFIDILVSHGWLEGRTEKVAGKLTANKVEIRNALEDAGVL